MPVTIDDSQLRWKLNDLREVMIGKGKDVSTLLQDETRLLSRMIVNFTPPIAMRGENSRQTGERAIRTELYNMASEAAPKLIDEIGSEHGVSNIRGFFTKRDGTKKEIKWDHLDPTGDRLPIYHKRYRNRRGKVPLVKPGGDVWASRVVVPYGALKAYVAKKIKMVGWAKAHWALVAARLGEHHPMWIARHFSRSLATADINLDPVSPSIRFGSRMNVNNRIMSDVRHAVKVRTQVIKRKIIATIHDHNKDLMRNMRLQTKARMRRETLPPVE